MEGGARPGGVRPGRDADADRLEALFECHRGIGEAGGNARGFLETARQLRDDAPLCLGRARWSHIAFGRLRTQSWSRRGALLCLWAKWRRS